VMQYWANQHLCMQFELGAEPDWEPEFLHFKIKSAA